MQSLPINSILVVLSIVSDGTFERPEHMSGSLLNNLPAVYNTPALGGRSSDNLQQPDTKTLSVSLWSEATVHSGIMHAI